MSESQPFPGEFLKEKAELIFLRLDSAQVVVEANAFARRFLGFDPRDRSAPSLFVNFSEPPDLAALARSGQSQRLSLADGSGLPRTLTVDVQAEAGGFCLFAQVDVEEALRTEQSIIRLASELGLLNRELNRKHAELSAAQQRLVELLRFRAFITAGLSHDMKNPLHAILGLADLLELHPGPAELHRYSESLRVNGEFLSQLVSNFLDFSRLEAGKLEVVEAPFEVRRLLEVVLSPFLLRPKPGILLGYSVAANIPETLVGDAFRIKQILSNLVGNALKFTERGEIRISVATEEADSPQTAFSVRDTGPGIPLERQDGIFSPWSQGNRDDERIRGGFGLGLAMVSSLTRMMNGSVRLESSPGKGAVFTVLLPLRTGRTSQVPRQRTTAGASALRVLVADDMDINRQILRKLLELDGHIVDEASDGGMAVRLALESRYDLLLLDCLMKDMDGFEAASRIRSGELPHRPRLPIVAVTGLSLDEERRRIIDAGMDDFLEKPVRIEALRATVRRFAPARGSG